MGDGWSSRSLRRHERAMVILRKVKRKAKDRSRVASNANGLRGRRIEHWGREFVEERAGTEFRNGEAENGKGKLRNCYTRRTVADTPLWTFCRGRNGEIKHELHCGNVTLRFVYGRDSVVSFDSGCVHVSQAIKY